MPIIDNLPVLNPDPAKKTGVQKTTFSVDMISRFCLNTWDEATKAVTSQNLESASAMFDAIVIGSGMYGGYCAQHLWRRGAKVLLLEAGPFLVPEHGQNLARGLDINAPGAALPESGDGQSTRNQVWGIPWRGNQVFPGLAFCVGGKSLFWGGWSPRLTDDVLDDFPSGARDYLKKNYERIEVQLGVAQLLPSGGTTSGTGFIDDTGADGLTAILTSKIVKLVESTIPPKGIEKPQKAPIAVQGQPPTSGLFSFDKFATPPLLFDALREDIKRSGEEDTRRNFFLVPLCRVLRLNADNGVVNRIDVFTDGVRKSLDIPPTCNVVLASSCIESTRLALESFPTPLMGRNLMVHLRSNIAVRIPRAQFSGLKTGIVETAAVHVPGISTKGGRFHIQIVGAANRNNNAEEVWFRTVPSPEILEQLLLNQDGDFVSLQLRGCGEMLGIKDQGSPDANTSWIDLSPETDEFNLRRAYVHLKTVPADDELWDEMDDALLSLAERLGGGQTEFWVGGNWTKNRPPQGKLTSEGGIRDALGTTFHECGTLWMGEDPFPSVTDSTGRFRHIANAYCADQSLFTRSGSANPVPTGMTLARQTAEAASPQPRGFAMESGFRSIFNFTKPSDPLPEGWDHIGSGRFFCLGEVLEAEGGIGLLVYKKEELTDFVLKIEWRAPLLDNNSGIYVRLPKEASNNFDQALKSGYEIQIDNKGERPGQPFSLGSNEFFNPFHQTGAIYPVHGVSNPPQPNGKASRSPIPTKAFGQWNEYEIQVQANRIKVLLNGQETLDNGGYVDDNNTYPKGFIALQNHFKGFRVQFRNARLKA